MIPKRNAKIFFLYSSSSQRTTPTIRCKKKKTWRSHWKMSGTQLTCKMLNRFKFPFIISNWVAVRIIIFFRGIQLHYLVEKLSVFIGLRANNPQNWNNFQVWTFFHVHRILLHYFLLLTHGNSNTLFEYITLKININFNHLAGFSAQLNLSSRLWILLENLSK